MSSENWELKKQNAGQRRMLRRNERLPESALVLKNADSCSLLPK
jgi:hypothetical protein